MSTLIDIAPGISYSQSANVLIETTKNKVEPDDQNDYSSQEWSRWGSNNDYPQKVIDKVTQDTTSMGAMGFKTDAHYGGGIMLFEKNNEGKKEEIIPLEVEDYPEIDKFFFENDIENFSQGIIDDYEWWNRCLIQYIPNVSGNKIHSIKWQKTKDVRKAKLDKTTGKIPGYYLSGNWPNPKEDEYVLLPSFDKSDPFGKHNAIHEHSRANSRTTYYNIPVWQAKMNWLEVASKIPKWIIANIENSMNLKYHVVIPEQYFIDLYPADRYESEEEAQAARKAAETKLKKEISDSLTGEDNVGKVFYTKFAVDQMGKPMPGWEINELKWDIKDKAWLQADQVAASRILTADGVPPSLAGIIIGNTSSGSASDVREQFNYYLQMKTVIPRQTTTEWFYFLKRFNQWDQKYGKRFHFGYKQIILQSMDQNKSGAVTQNEPTPTTDNPL